MVTATEDTSSESHEATLMSSRRTSTMTRGSLWLATTGQQPSSNLSNQSSVGPSPMRSTMRALAAAQERTGEAAESSGLMLALLVRLPAKEHVRCHALSSAECSATKAKRSGSGRTAKWSYSQTPGPLRPAIIPSGRACARIRVSLRWWVRIRSSRLLRRCLRSWYGGSSLRRDSPLRNAGAQLHVIVLARDPVPLCDPTLAISNETTCRGEVAHQPSGNCGGA